MTLASTPPEGFIRKASPGKLLCHLHFASAETRGCRYQNRRDPTRNPTRAAPRRCRALAELLAWGEGGHKTAPRKGLSVGMKTAEKSRISKHLSQVGKKKDQNKHQGQVRGEGGKRSHTLKVLFHQHHHTAPHPASAHPPAPHTLPGV